MTGARTMQAGEFVLQYTTVYYDRHSALFQSLFRHCSHNFFEKKIEIIFLKKNQIK